MKAGGIIMLDSLKRLLIGKPLKNEIATGIIPPGLLGPLVIVAGWLTVCGQQPPQVEPALDVAAHLGHGGFDPVMPGHHHDMRVVLASGLFGPPVED